MNLLEYLQTNKIKIIDNSIILPEGDWVLENNILTLHNDNLRKYLKDKFFVRVGEKSYHLVKDTDLERYVSHFKCNALENYNNFYIPLDDEKIYFSDIKDFSYDDSNCSFVAKEISFYYFPEDYMFYKHE